MKKITLLVALCFPIALSAQWESVAGGILYGSTYSVFHDTLDARIYLTGNMRYMTQDSLEVRAVTYWVDGTWHKMRSGTTWIGNGAAPPVQAIVRYDTTIVIAGQIRKVDSIPDTKGVAQWYGGSWHSMGIDSADFLSPNPFALAVIEDTLHMMGSYAFVYAGDTIRSWATYDGSTWRRGDPVEVPYQVGAACKYQDELYIGGNFTLSNGINDIAKRGATGWEQLGQGLLGDPWVNDMVVFDGLLWVAGEFYQSGGNAASGLMAWDGAQWIEPFPMINMFAQGRNLTVSNGKLYFTGAINVDGVPGDFTLGQYDGSQLCILGGPDVIADDVAATSDTIYITCCKHLFCLNQGLQVNNFAKWPLTAPPDACFDVLVGVQELASQQPALHVWPNPAQDLLYLSNATAGRVTVTDATGRQVMAVQVPAQGTVPVVALASGCYVLHLHSEQGQLLGVVRFAKE